MWGGKCKRRKELKETVNGEWGGYGEFTNDGTNLAKKQAGNNS